MADNAPANAPATGHIEVDENADISDSAYAGSDASDLTSVVSAIRKGMQENGRVYPTYGTHEYGVPIDERELDRQDLHHHAYTMLQDDKLHLAPLSASVEEILDIGTGTGIWCVEMADKFPGATITGTDIAPVQPSWVPPNCSFIIDDCERDWQFSQRFDYIHSRDCYMSVRDWPRLVRQAYAHLKPGGWLELACIIPYPESDDGTLPRDSGYVQLCETMVEIGKSFDAPLDTPLKYKQLMADAGFENVQQTNFKMPTSEWPKDKRLKKIGAFERINVIEGAEGFMLRGFTEKLGRSREEMELIIMRMRKELLSNKLHAYTPFVVAYGQKPQNAAA